MSTAQYSGRSFRMGAATMAAKLDVPDSLIKKMGRWKSSVFMHYLHSMTAAGRHLIVAGAEGQSITHFQHVLLTPLFVSMMLCSGFDLRNYLEWKV